MCVMLLLMVLRELCVCYAITHGVEGGVCVCVMLCHGVEGGVCLCVCVCYAMSWC